MDQKKLNGIEKELKEISDHNPSGDPPTLQAKKLAILQSQILLELITTLKGLDGSNKKLAESNLRLQRGVVALTLAAVVIAIVK